MLAERPVRNGKGQGERWWWMKRKMKEMPELSGRVNDQTELTILRFITS